MFASGASHMYSNILLIAVVVVFLTLWEDNFGEKEDWIFKECGDSIQFHEQNLFTGSRHEITVIFGQSQVRVSVIQMLPSAELDDLPVVVKFILQSVGDSDAFEVQKSETRALTKIVTTVQ